MKRVSMNLILHCLVTKWCKIECKFRGMWVPWVPGACILTEQMTSLLSPTENNNNKIPGTLSQCSEQEFNWVLLRATDIKCVLCASSLYSCVYNLKMFSHTSLWNPVLGPINLWGPTSILWLQEHRQNQQEIPAMVVLDVRGRLNQQRHTLKNP